MQIIDYDDKTPIKIKFQIDKRNVIFKVILLSKTTTTVKTSYFFSCDDWRLKLYKPNSRGLLCLDENNFIILTK